MNPHLLYPIIFPYPCLLLALCSNSERNAWSKRLRKKKRENKQENNFVLVVSTFWLALNRPLSFPLHWRQAEIAVKSLEWTLALRGTFSLHRFTSQNCYCSLPHHMGQHRSFFLVFHKLISGFRDLTLCLCLWKSSLQSWLVKYHIILHWNRKSSFAT